MWAASTVLGELLRPKPKFNAPQPSALGDITAPTAEYGRAIPVAYGKVFCKAPNATWMGHLRQKAVTQKVKTGLFSSQDVFKCYHYHLGMQLAFCHGFSPREIERGSGLVELRFDEKRPTGLGSPLTFPMPNTPVLNGLMPYRNASYSVQRFNSTNLDTCFDRVSIHDPDLFGGDESEGGISGTIDVHYGQGGQLPSDYLQSVWGSADIPAFRGTCYAVLRQCYVGTSKYIKPVGAIVKRYPWFFAAANGHQIGEDANPIAVIVDLMSNEEYGLKIPLDTFDLQNFEAAAMRCLQENIGISVLYDTQSEASELIRDILRHIDGVMYTDPTTGKMKIALARDDYDLDAVPALNSDNVSELKLVRGSWNDTKNVVKVKYTNAAADFAVDLVEHKNQANIDVRGAKDEETYQFLGFTNVTAANQAAARILRSVSTPLARMTITANREAFALHPGAVFRLDWPPLGISGMACRVTRISYGGLTDPEVSIEAVEDVFGTMSTAFTAPEDGRESWQDPSLQPVAAHTAERLFEVPFHLAGGAYRQVAALASRGDEMTAGYKVYSVRAGGYVETNNVYSHVPSGTLVSAYSRKTAAVDEHGITLDMSIDVAQLDNSGSNLMLIGDELMAYRSATLNADGTVSVTGIVRGAFDTLPADHAAGSRVWFISEGGGLVQPEAYITDQAVVAAMAPYSLREQTEPGNNLAIATTSRALKPYPVGRLRVNNLAFAARTTGNATVSWAHRNKQYMLQAGVVASQDDAGAGPADGTYRVVVRINGTTVRTVEVGTATGFTYTAAQRIADAVAGTVTFTVTTTSGDYSTSRSTDPVQMTGLGMCLGYALGGMQD